MATRQYIGARYVIKVYENSLDPNSAEWENVAFEPLTMVTYQNSSYLSKKQVPANVGNPATATAYWVVTGYYNGQISALQTAVAALNTKIGDLDNLPTTDKDSIVDAIIELNTTIDSEITALTNNLSTFDYLKSGYTNVLSLGVKNDGSEDCSTIINDNADKPLYFPSGKYRFDSTLHLQNSIKGEGIPLCWKTNHCDCTIFDFTMSDSSHAIEYGGNINEKSMSISNLLIQMSGGGTGDGIHLTTTNARLCIENVDILNIKGAGIYAYPTEAASGYLNVRNIQVWGVYGAPTVGSKGIICGANAMDCTFINCLLFGVQIGITLYGGNCKIIGGQIWCAGGTDSSAYYNNTLCVDIYASGTVIEGLYFDSAHVLIHTGPNGKIVTVTGCNAYWGAYETLRAFDPPTLFVMANAATTIYVKNTYIEIPFSVFFVSNRIQNIVGSPIFSGYGDNNTFSFAHSAKCDYDNRYAWRIDTANGHYVEIARMTLYASVYASIGNWQMLITARGGGNAVEFIKIGTGLNVFYKESGGHFKIYAFVPDPYDCVITGLTTGVINPAYTLLNGERLTFDQQNDTTGLSAATEKQWINT